MLRRFHNMRISRKLQVSSLLFALPISVLLYFMVSGINHNIRFATLELYGNRYQRPLEDLLRGIPEHQRLVTEAISLGVSHDRSVVVGEVEARIDKAFADLGAVDQAVGRDLQFTPEGLSKRNREHLRLPLVLTEWEKAKQWRGKTVHIAASEHDSLIKVVREMVTHSGDSSNLILDPDLDSYYCMDVTLLALPQAQERLALVISYGENVLGRGEPPTDEQRLWLIVHSTLLQDAAIARISYSIKTALNEDPNFHGVSPSLRKNVLPVFQEYEKATQAFLDALNQMGFGASTPMTTERFIELSGKARDLSFKLWTAVAGELDVLLERRIAQYRHVRAWALGLTTLALAVAVLLVSAIGISFLRPLRALTEETYRIASGLNRLEATDDAGTTRASREELGLLAESFRRMVHELESITGRVAAATSDVTSSVTGISAAIDEQAAVLNQQSALVTQITAAMEEFSQTSKQIAGLSNSVVAIATRALEGVETGARAVETIMANMRKIDQVSQTSTRGVLGLGAKSKEIGKVMEIISQIADQTKLIAFNAAIEASSAGDSGKRFGVVADEIRRLAEDVTKSTGEIDATIKAIQHDVDRLVEVSEQGVEQIRESLAHTNQTASLLAEIIEGSKSTVTAASQISLSTMQQETASVQVVGALREMDQGARQTSKSIAQISASTTTLKNLADELKLIVEQFRVESSL